MSEQKIHIVQCLCPRRHCICALAYAPGLTSAQADHPGGFKDITLRGFKDITLTEKNAVDYLRGMVKGLIERKTLNPWCGLCHSRVFSYEDRATNFRTMEEALPHLRRDEAEQARTRAILGGSRN